MNREIKFRVFDKISKQMYRWSQIASISLVDFDKEHYELMQFTGLKDKNGVDIYEGDIIKNERGDWGVVVIKDHCFEVTVSEDQSSLYAKEYYNNSEIIGNIHENPELLKQ